MNWKRIAIGGGVAAGLIGIGVLFTATDGDIGTEQVMLEGEAQRARYAELKPAIAEYQESHPSWNVEGHADYWRAHPEGSRLVTDAFEIWESSTETRDELNGWFLRNCAGRPTPTYLQARRDPLYSQYVSGRNPEPPLRYITPESAEVREQCTVVRTEIDALRVVIKEIWEFQ